MKKGDLALIAVLLIALLAGGGWWLLGRSGGNGANAGSNTGSAATDASTDLVVVCQTKDGFYRCDALSKDASYTVETEGTGSGDDADGGTNVVRIENGTVEVESANCANQVCVEHDPISEAGEQIVCLPHGLVVQVAESEDDVAPLV